MVYFFVNFTKKLHIIQVQAELPFSTCNCELSVFNDIEGVS